MRFSRSRLITGCRLFVAAAVRSIQYLVKKEDEDELGDKTGLSVMETGGLPDGSLLYMERISFSSMGKDLSWSLEKATPGFARAANTHIGLISNSPSSMRTSSAARNRLPIFSEGLISDSWVDFGHCSI